MQLYTPLTSAVNVAVKAPRPKMKMQDVHTLESWETQKWKLTAQTKPVETSIWGQYSMNEDPTRVKGPIGGLLDGKNATMQLVTGISIVPPDPAMAGDKINIFNVTKDHMETVFQPGQKEWPLFIDVLKDQDQAWAPRERGTKWCEVKKAWAKVGDDTTSKAVDLWAKRMRYDKQSFDADQKDESLRKSFKPLRGVSPKKLVDKFELLVPALPLIAAG